jgi:hypothetical protein
MALGDYACSCYLLHAGFMLWLFLDLKTEAIYSSETSVDFQWTAWCYTPENITLYMKAAHV